MTTPKVPFLDLVSAFRAQQPQIEAALLRVAASGWYLSGQEVATFEKNFASDCGAQFCVGTGNGLDALHLALLALGVGEGDEVIVPSNTFIATWLAVTRCGATPVPVEPLDATYNIDPSRIEAALTARTKVIVPVHLYGQSADMDPIMAIARHHGLKVLDDCAQAHAATYKGRPVGSLADVSAWSFYPGKNLGAFGDAGAVTTSDERMARQVRMLGNYGSTTKYRHELLGYNSRLDEMQAAVLDAKLQGLAYATQQRRRIAGYYLSALHNLPIQLPEVPDFANPAWHLFVVRHPQRDRLQRDLAERGIGTLIHYPVPPHLQPAYAQLGMGRGAFPISEAMHDQVLSLPMWPGLSDEQIGQVVDALKASA